MWSTPTIPICPPTKRGSPPSFCMASADIRNNTSYTSFWLLRATFRSSSGNVNVTRKYGTGKSMFCCFSNHSCAFPFWHLGQCRFRHPRKTGGWCVNRYWKQRGNRKNFGDGTAWLVKYADTPIKRHIKVRGDKSPYDGDWPYWIRRRGRDPTKPTRVLNLLKRQKCRCGLCGLYFKAEDVVEMHHWSLS